MENMNCIVLNNQDCFQCKEGEFLKIVGNWVIQYNKEGRKLRQIPINSIFYISDEI